MEEEKKTTKKKSTSTKTTTKKKTTAKPAVKKTTTKKSTTSKTTTKKSTTKKPVEKKLTVKKTSTKKTTPKKKTTSKVESSIENLIPEVITTPKPKKSTRKTTPKKVVTPIVETQEENNTPEITTNKTKVIKVTIKRKRTTKKKETDSVTNAINNINNIIDSLDDVESNLEEKNIDLSNKEPEVEPVETSAVEKEFKSIIDNVERAEEDFKYEGPAPEEPKIVFDDIAPAEEDYKYEGPVIEETNTIFDEPMDEVVIEGPPKEDLTPQTDSIEEQVDITPVKTKPKLKKGAKLVILLLILGIVSFVIFFFVCNKKEPSKEIVINASCYNNLGVVEFKCVNTKLENVIINSNMINDMKAKSTKYTKKIEDVLKDSNNDPYLLSNIRTALELDIINKKDTLTEYYYKVLGFNSLDDLVDLFNETIESKKNQK